MKIDTKIAIRQARYSDIEGIAYVGYNSWITTYTGIFPDELIQQRSPEKRIPHIRENWRGFEEDSEENPTRNFLVAENNMGKIVGYVNGGEIFHKEQNYDCEMYAFYILQEYQGQGIGTRLFYQMLKFLKTFEHKSMIIWVLKENPACLFYEKMGGKAKESMIDQRDCKDHEVIGYVWNNIHKI
ncbi:MAG: GNAT family N-acetyltransferase [Candidatus Heimdallarchaeota archaeon]|nr:GNAT family N-acetyltransferase [Candidatus Heimdallarchaeota archaeon]